MKVFLVCNYFMTPGSDKPEIGGIHTYIENLLTCMDAWGYPVDLFQYSSVPFEKQLGASCRVIGFVPGKNRNDLRPLVKQAEASADLQHDLLLFSTSLMICRHHFHNSVAIQHGISWDVTTVHGLSPRFPFDQLLRSIQARVLIRQHRRISRMICVDYNYVNWLRSQTVDRTLCYRVIPNFAEPMPPRTECNENSPIRLLFARRFEKIRGVELLYTLLPRLLNRYPQLTVTLAGGGSMESDLRQRFSNEPRITFTVYDAKQSVQFHRDYDLAIIPTIGSEGTSLSLLEAMAAGCAVVCSDVGGMTNIILDGYNGRIVAPDAAAFEQAICELIDDPAARLAMAERGRQTAAAAFSLERWQKQWRAVLEEFAAGEGG